MARSVPNSFLNPKPIDSKTLKPTNNLPFLKKPNVGPKPKASGFLNEVAQQFKRISGVTPAVVRGYQEKPARFIKKQKLNLAGLGKKGMG